MEPQDLTSENFAFIITAASTRSELLAAMRAESSTCLPLSNRVSDIAQQFKTDRRQLAEIVETELNEQRRDFICDLVFHPDIDDATLTKVYDSGLCTVELAHRAGPPALLEKIANEHRIEEAVLTLLLNYYASDAYTNAQFTEFIRRFASVHSVQYELNNKTNIPDHKRTLGKRVLAGLPE